MKEADIILATGGPGMVKAAYSSGTPALGVGAGNADALGIAGKSRGEQFNNLVKAIRELQARIGIKPTIRDYVPDEKDFLDRLDAMVEQAFDDQCTGANPRYPLISEIKQMYLNAYYGRHEAV